ncbi:unnamed protein product [Didymodactylos carnosus]|uniref:Uncharacterized protein n=1 Tax=Didymodactylos carnosus TaxID=1234261 RepID=A0A814TRQ8_9BILA|nr:unnamed protein product [Didymodactylos carnosus]CAF1165055.1 unnamed protein product [Didymodactylos carnosus]CAF3809878.1 unnamed protein product [Didymodactylos carnosus]CAF3928670.1 unnamed protein product [Didymodactylos carnosus]
MGSLIGIHEHEHVHEHVTTIPERLSDEQLTKLELKTRCCKNKIEHYYEEFRLNHPTGYITKKEFLKAHHALFPHSEYDKDAFRNDFAINESNSL